jgi:hypothetical protein
MHQSPEIEPVKYPPACALLASKCGQSVGDAPGHERHSALAMALRLLIC